MEPSLVFFYYYHVFVNKSLIMIYYLITVILSLFLTFSTCRLKYLVIHLLLVLRGHIGSKAYSCLWVLHLICQVERVSLGSSPLSFSRSYWREYSRVWVRLMLVRSSPQRTHNQARRRAACWHNRWWRARVWDTFEAIESVNLPIIFPLRYGSKTSASTLCTCWNPIWLILFSFHSLRFCPGVIPFSSFLSGRVKRLLVWRKEWCTKSFKYPQWHMNMELTCIRNGITY